MMIHAAALKPMARPVREIMEGFMETPRQKPMSSYLFIP